MQILPSTQTIYIYIYIYIYYGGLIYNDVLITLLDSKYKLNIIYMIIQSGNYLDVTLIY